MKRWLIVVYIALCWLSVGQHQAHAAEGAASHYFPGFAGTFAVTVAPDPGPMFLNSTLIGYYYTQVSGDSGAGATLGDFQGESVGVGPALLWIPRWSGGKLILSGKWLHALHAKNRFESEPQPLLATERR